MVSKMSSKDKLERPPRPPTPGEQFDHDLQKVPLATGAELQKKLEADFCIMDKELLKILRRVREWRSQVRWEERCSNNWVENAKSQ